MSQLKKFTVLFALMAMLFAATPSWASVDFEDPALCINGEWLVVNAATAQATHVFVPKGARYGDQREGGCQTPPPAPLFPKSVVSERGDGNMLHVMIDGRGASKPSVTVSYGAETQTKQNHGEPMHFEFKLRAQR